MSDRFELGYKAHEKEDYKGALEHYLHALNDPKAFSDPKILHYLGSLLLQMGYNGAGANILSRAVQCDPNNYDSFINLGACYFKEWDLEGAKDIWGMALEQALAKAEPDSETLCGILSNIAGAGIHAGDYQMAIDYFEKALAYKPNAIQPLSNFGLAKLAVGDWAGAWPLYEEHLRLNTRRRREYKNVPTWNGEEGKEVIVYGEQGIGDEIMFASMLPDLIKVSKRVIFDCHPRLVNTFKRSFGIECYGTRKTDQCEWFPGCGANAVTAVGSLGRLFRNTREAFPGTPYLTPRTARPTKHPKDKPRIGLSWKGGTKQTGDKLRSMTLDELAPLVQAFPEVEWYSLQYHEDSSRYVLEAEERLGIHLIHRPAALEGFDYDSTIDLVNSLDLVITVPTSVLHVAGAIGVPTWVMVQKEAAWRETGNVPGRGPSMPWYNSVKLYHKTTDDWHPLVMRVMSDLGDFLAPARDE